jgi:hypothetical protein
MTVRPELIEGRTVIWAATRMGLKAQVRLIFHLNKININDDM